MGPPRATFWAGGARAEAHPRGRERERPFSRKQWEDVRRHQKQQRANAVRRRRAEEPSADDAAAPRNSMVEPNIFTQRRLVAQAPDPVVGTTGGHIAPRMYPPDRETSATPERATAALQNAAEAPRVSARLATLAPCSAEAFAAPQPTQPFPECPPSRHLALQPPRIGELSTSRRRITPRIPRSPPLGGNAKQLGRGGGYQAVGRQRIYYGNARKIGPHEPRPTIPSPNVLPLKTR